MTRFTMATLGVTLLSIAATRPSPPPELHTYAVNEAASELYVVVHRAGLLSFLGHEHAIVPVRWSSELCLDDSLSAGAHASLVVETASLVIDSDSARALAGMEGGPSAEDRETIQARMLGPAYLAAADFPWIRLELRSAGTGGNARVAVRGSITLRGVTRDFELPVAVERADTGRLALTGVLRIRLRDFGIEPESRAGVVKVSNDVDLHFAISASPTQQGCSAD